MLSSEKKDKFHLKIKYWRKRFSEDNKLGSTVESTSGHAQRNETMRQSQVSLALAMAKNQNLTVIYSQKTEIQTHRLHTPTEREREGATLYNIKHTLYI